MDEFGFDYDDANYVIATTAQNTTSPNSEWKTPHAEGFITLRYHGLSRFTLEDHTEKPDKPLPIKGRLEYNRSGKGLPDGKKASTSHRRDTHMPPARGRRAATAPAPAPEPEPEANGQVDFQKYLDKDLSPTMQDYVEWFEQEVASLDDVPVDKILVLGSSLYPHFQKSDFNIERREARKSARQPAPEPESAKPAAKGRSRRAAPEPEPEPEPDPAPAPAKRGRGRPARSAAAEAPY
jgi:hypothetical protein